MQMIIHSAKLWHMCPEMNEWMNESDATWIHSDSFTALFIHSISFHFVKDFSFQMVQKPLSGTCNNPQCSGYVCVMNECKSYIVCVRASLSILSNSSWKILTCLRTFGMISKLKKWGLKAARVSSQTNFASDSVKAHTHTARMENRQFHSAKWRRRTVDCLQHPIYSIACASGSITIERSELWSYWKASLIDKTISNGIHTQCYAITLELLWWRMSFSLFTSNCSNALTQCCYCCCSCISIFISM